MRRGGASAELLALAPSGLGPCHARRNGFDLHAGVVVPPRDRARLERLCRYALRPPIAQERLHLTSEGQVVLDLRHRWADGTTYLVFEPLELLERLAALTPRPRINLLLYYGVLGARSVWRSRIAAIDGERSEARSGVTPDRVSAPGAPDRPKTNWLWAELMQRSFGFDVLACPRCGGRLELIALIEDPSVIRRRPEASWPAHRGTRRTPGAAAAAANRATGYVVRRRHSGSLTCDEHVSRCSPGGRVRRRVPGRRRLTGACAGRDDPRRAQGAICAVP
ncbi:MAG: transposase [Acidobacteria bacterium]|nr:transposase [Acidobacteriota bacterium]